MKQKTSVEKVEKDLFLVLKVKNCTKEILAQNRRKFELDNSFCRVSFKISRMNDDLPSFLQDFKDIFQEYFDSLHQHNSFLMKLNAI